MKRILILFFIFSINVVKAEPSILKISTNEKIFNGVFGDYQAVQLYLRYQEHSCCHMFSYYVNGWYSIGDNDRVLLTGVYHENELYLYRFSNQKNDFCLSELLTGPASFWDFMEELKNLTDYDERIIVREEKNTIIGTWDNQVVTVAVDYIRPKNIEVYETNSYLIFDANHSFNLSNLPLSRCDIQFVSSANNDKVVILYYTQMSRAYVLGMCGAGEEIGYFRLTFDEKFNFLSCEGFQIESCLNDKILVQTDQDKLEIRQKYWDGESDSENELIINKANCSISINPYE
jgi:hypothetical protein